MAVSHFYQKIVEFGFIFFICILFAIYRTQIWRMIKEFLLDMALALLLTGVITTMFFVYNLTWQATIFILMLVVILGVRFLYFYFKGTPMGKVPH